MNPPSSVDDASTQSAPRQQEAIADVGREALDTDDIDRLLHDASIAVAETLDVDYVSLLKLLPSGDEAVLTTGLGWREDLVGSTTVPVVQGSQAEYVLQTEQVVIVDDVRTESRFDIPELIDGHDITSCASVIIGSLENPWGSIAIHTTDTREFTEQDAGFLQAIATILASAIVSDRTRSELEETYDRISDAFFGLDEEWRFTYLNERAHDVINPDDRELEGACIWDAFPEATARKFKSEYERAMDEQQTVSFEEYYPEPLDAWFDVRAYPSETGLSVYFRDITERKAREDEIADREQALRSAYEIIADADRSVSEQIDALLAVVRDHLGTDFAIFSHIHDDRYEFERVAVTPEIGLEAGESTDLAELPLCEQVVQSGESLVISDVPAEAPEFVDPAWGIACYLGAPVVVDDEPYGTFCFYDVEPRSEEFTDWERTLVELLSDWVGSELTRQQTREQIQQQNERLEEFTNVVSHDLRNPLSVAQGWLESAQEEVDSEPLQKVETAHTRMETLIADLRELARTGDEVTEYTSVDLAALVSDCWAAVETGDATLVADIDRVLEADRSRLKQLFENLVRNAVDHGGDSVTVTVGGSDDGFFVADDGPGVPEAERGDVFEAGFSTDPDGTGFGLSIVKQVAEAHEWGIQVAESEDGGARFEITGVEFAE